MLEPNGKLVMFEHIPDDMVGEALAGIKTLATAQA